VSGGDLIDQLGRALCNGPPATTDRSIAANLTFIVSRAGSNRAAARSLGVAESTFRGWLKGSKPRRSPQSIAAAARAWQSLGRYGTARAGSLVIHAIVSKSKDTRDRKLHVGRHIPKAVMGRILTRWLKAEPDDKVEASLYRAIDKYYTGDLDFDGIIGVWFAGE